MTDEHPPIIKELLSHDERQIVAGVNIPDDGELTEGQRRDVAEAVRAYLADNKITLRAFVRSIGVLGQPSWSQILNGIYESSKLDDYLRQANRWIDDDARRRVAREQPEFVPTPVAETIHTAVELAKQNRSIYIVVGPSGIGKSFCAKIAQEQSPGTILLELDSDLHTHRQIRDALVAELGLDRVRACGGREVRSLPKREYAAALIRRLHGTARLIIIDEGHEIDRTGREFVHHLHDKTGCPVLILATIDLWDEIMDGADEDRG